jgi:hypothetical protein
MEYAESTYNKRAYPYRISYVSLSIRISQTPGKILVSDSSKYQIRKFTDRHITLHALECPGMGMKVTRIGTKYRWQLRRFHLLPFTAFLDRFLERNTVPANKTQTNKQKNYS